MRRRLHFNFITGLAAGLGLAAVLAVGGLLLYRAWFWQGRLSPSDKTRQVLALLEAHSIVPYDRAELLENMYRGLLSGVGDPYTYYFDAEALAELNEQTEGVYAGVGMTVTADPNGGAVTVVTVYPGSPAERGGLRADDRIVAVDGEDATALTMEEVTSRTRGTPGSSVTLTLFRPSEGASFDAALTRESISVPTVAHGLAEESIGYIRIEQFERVTLGQFDEACVDLTAQGVKGLILDLRGNPGGLMETVTGIADRLLPEAVITYTEDKQGRREDYRSDADTLGLPVAVLVNAGSASASEVLCGALRDILQAPLVGEKTFGKGVVQNLYNLSDGSAVKITVSQYYSPDGVSIQGEGFTPDYPVAYEPGVAASDGGLPSVEDAQYQKALEVMRGLIAS